MTLTTLNGSTKGRKVSVAILAVFLFVLFNDSFITHNYFSNSPISSNWFSVERYFLAILSSAVFVRGIYGFKMDKNLSKEISDVYFGYHWATKEPTQLIDDFNQFENKKDSKNDINPLYLKVKKYFLKYISILSVLLFAVASFEMLTGFYLNFGRTSIDSDVIPFNGVTAWGDSQAMFNFIALLEIMIQSVFVLVFARGVIGFYHDYQLSEKYEKGFFVFQDLNVPLLDKINQAIKNKFKKKQD